MIKSVNPATGEVVRQFESDRDEVVESKLEQASKAYCAYREIPARQRAQWLEATAALLSAERNEAARIMTVEMGKPIRAAEQEVDKCAAACRFYAEHGEGFLRSDPIAWVDGDARVEYHPLGPILAVMPWNFPLWQVFRFAVPALLAGNVGLLKHASNVPQCALYIEDVFRRAGFPRGIFQTLLIRGPVAEKLIADPRIVAVTLTGSVEAGRKVAAAAGAALKKTVLELGGSDPFIVMPSADLESTAAAAVQARCINNGQSCIAAKRFIVHREVKNQFMRLFVERMSQLKVGDPTLLETDVGPLATEDVLLSLEKQVNRTVAKGARVLLGGNRLPGPGYFYAPTVLDAIPAGSPADQEELFGPVASLFAAEDLSSALKIANRTRFGLGASIWTEDESESSTFVREIQSGLAFVNGMVVSDPRLPFGGVGDSGYGRELGAHGMREFLNIKTVVIRRGGTPPRKPGARSE